MKRHNLLLSTLLAGALMLGQVVPVTNVFASTETSDMQYLNQISALMQQDGDLTKTMTIILSEDRIVDEEGKDIDIESVDEDIKESLDLSTSKAVEKLSDDYSILERDSDKITIASPYQTKRIVVKGSLGNLKKEYKPKVALHHGNEWILQFDTEEETKTAYEKLQKNSSVSSVWVDQVIQLDVEDEMSAASFTDVEPGTHYSWGVAAMGMDKMSEKLEAMGNLPEVVVAVIDTGINYNNKYLQGRIVSGGKNFSPSEGDYYDNHGHGTHVSGIITDSTPSNVKILPVKVLGDDGKGTNLSVRSGVQYATSMHANVMNLSLGGFSMTTVTKKESSVYDQAVKKGIAVCVAAGNDASDVSHQSPANVPSVFTISNMRSDRTLSSSSCFGEGIDFTAPGTSILSAWRDGMGTKSGTSMASPHVAAACALLKSTNISMSVNQIEKEFIAHCEDLGEPGKDIKFGYGLINLADYLSDAPEVPDVPSQPENPEVPDVHEHVYVSVVLNEATCTKEGHIADECVICHQRINETTTPALGHDYVNTGKKGKKTTYKCTRCEHQYKSK